MSKTTWQVEHKDACSALTSALNAAMLAANAGDFEACGDSLGDAKKWLSKADKATARGAKEQAAYEKSLKGKK